MPSLNNPAKSPLVVAEDKRIEITEMPFTLPKDGWVWIAVKHGRYGFVGIENLTTGMSVGDAATQAGYYAHMMMFGNAGDVINLEGDSPGFLAGYFSEFK